MYVMCCLFTPGGVGACGASEVGVPCEDRQSA